MMKNNEIVLLYVEDDEELRELYADFFQGMVNTILVAKDGAEGLEIFNEYSPDIIVTGIQMPVMNGIEMIRKIRQCNREIPILITSAYSEQEYFLQAIELGVTRYILKPIKSDSLKLTINETIEYIILKKKEEIFAKNEKFLMQKAKRVAMGEMVEMIAHQWRQPLNAVSAAAIKLDMLGQLGKLSEDELSATLKFIQDMSHDMSHTIDYFLEFTKLDQAKEYFFIKDAIELATKIIRAELESDNINLKWSENENDKISLYGDMNELTNVLLTMMVNTRDAFKNQDISNKWIEIQTYKEENQIFISVKDNAGGVVSSQIDRIFDPFFTTKPTLKEAGLDLYKSNKIIEEHFGGSITATRIENGLMINIILPIFQDQ